MCVRYIDGLPFIHPQLGTRPATQACALTGGIEPVILGSQAGTESTEPHQPEQEWHFLTSLDPCTLREDPV